jgi:hypothetical protein
VKHRLVETITRFAPLGIRFWDVAAARPVRDGLRIVAWPEGSLGEGIPAFRTVSGVYAFSRLPGLEAVEWGEVATSGPDVIPLQRRFVVAVDDPARWFVPVAFLVDLPREERGIYRPAGAGSLPDNPVPGFPLFSAPSRPVMASVAVVRAQLEDELTGQAAAHAVLEVDIDGETWLGLADETGAVAVHFPLPPFHHPLAGSFPEGALPLHEYGWDVSVRLRYAPGTVQWAPEAGLPLLASLSDQAPGRLYAETPGSSVFVEPTDTVPATLFYGRETVLRSGTSSTLLVERAGSLP